MNENDLRQTMDKYGDLIYRYCLLSLCSHADAEDAVQDIFLIYYSKAPAFNDGEHKKAWLIRVAANKCRDIHRFRKRTMTEPEELLNTYPMTDENKKILEDLMEVPEKFRKPLILHYIEGFKINEIAEILNISASAVKMRLSKGRRLLKEIYRKG